VLDRECARDIDVSVGEIECRLRCSRSDAASSAHVEGDIELGRDDTRDLGGLVIAALAQPR
jgi:hypothetical protein